jgi:excisionase family DNA binding protein
MSHEPRQQVQQHPQQLLTPDDVAALLGVTRPFVIKKASQGKIPAIKLGKAWRFRATTIDSWLREQETGATGCAS